MKSEGKGLCVGVNISRIMQLYVLKSSHTGETGLYMRARLSREIENIKTNNREEIKPGSC